MSEKPIPEIDPDALDVEWLQQPSLFEAYSLRLADLEAERDTIEENRKTLRSQLIREARQGGKDVVGSSVTDSTVEAWYRVQEDWIDISKKFIEATRKAARAKGQVSAMHQRKAALENEVSLYRGHYFSAPSDNRDLPSSVEDFGRDVGAFRGDLMKDVVDDDVGKSLKKKRRKPSV